MEGLKKELSIRVQADFPGSTILHADPGLQIIDPLTNEHKPVQLFTIAIILDFDKNFQTYAVISINPGEEIYIVPQLISTYIQDINQGKFGLGTLLLEGADFSSKELIYNSQVHLYTDKVNFDKEKVKAAFRQLGLRLIIKEFENNFKFENRKALIIGMNNYQFANPLSKPVNDAIAMDMKLQSLGFETTLRNNLSQKDLKKAIDDFCEGSKTTDVCLVYYAGHGVQHNGVNYLIPVDADIDHHKKLEYDCVEADRILQLLAEKEIENKTNIIILDACRNNPFPKALSREVVVSGLAPMDAPRGTIIAYSTSPGKIAYEGQGTNSPYTTQILANIDYPNLKIEDMFKRIRLEVEKQTQGKQVPWETTSLVGDFFFKR